MSYVTCQNCGRSNADVARICRYCGSPLQHSAAHRPPGYAEPDARAGSYVPPHLWKSGSLPSQPQPYAPPQPQMQPQAHPQMQPFLAHAFRCPYCQSTDPPTLGRRISTGGWIVFAAMLIVCFPLFFIGLLIKEEYPMCSFCRTPLS